ncbi:hypothetical protein Aab01nite_82840 [Paractinoplanes abujensis]|nr:hypothetical protein Aab01nite_82840 [Actinoplanes abujensis]
MGSSQLAALTWNVRTLKRHSGSGAWEFVADLAALHTDAMLIKRDQCGGALPLDARANPTTGGLGLQTVDERPQMPTPPRGAGHSG